jgi:hypothetical protein
MRITRVAIVLHHPEKETNMKLGIAVVVTFFLVAAFAPGPPATAAQQRFTAAAVNTNNGGTGTVELVIERWSTEGERDRLLAALANQGQDKPLDTLQKMPRVGYIRMDAGLGYDLHYAYQTAGEDGGERVVLATDRPIGFWEAANRPRTIDYPFTVIELRVNGDGDGVGKLSLATRVTVDRSGHNVTLENYDTQPVMLQSVRRERAAR